MASLIEIRNMCKIYNPGENEVRALDHVSLSIGENEFVAIIGHSGSGKSTLMNMLGCLDVPTEGKYILNGKDVTAHLHDDRITNNASQVSAIVEIRHLVNDLMREITKSLSIVCEGRDMTTVVFPNAEYKIYLDASAEVRAKRRFDQGVSNLTLEEIKASIEKRDEMDKNKKEGSLKIAPDALYIDTSNLTIDNVCAIILKQIS